MSTFPVYTSCIEKIEFSILFTPGVFHIRPPHQAQQRPRRCFRRYDWSRYSLRPSVSASLSFSLPPLLPLLIKTTGGNLEITVTIYNRRPIQRNLEAFLNISRFSLRGYKAAVPLLASHLHSFSKSLSRSLSCSVFLTITAPFFLSLLHTRGDAHAHSRTCTCTPSQFHGTYLLSEPIRAVWMGLYAACLLNSGQNRGVCACLWQSSCTCWMCRRKNGRIGRRWPE